jgi:hypothetical protein
LTVYEDGAEQVTYPVGLGRDVTTPTGSFRVANMIMNPDWYNRGDVVPAGAPNNPLGNRWMGLGDANGATPYGIHPTAEQESIGGNDSQGCVRMRPADAVALFDLIRIGTPVRIAQRLLLVLLLPAMIISTIVLSGRGGFASYSYSWGIFDMLALMRVGDHFQVSKLLPDGMSRKSK